MYKAVIVKLKEIRKHPNADRLMLTTIEGNQVIVGLDAKEGDIGIYFPTDGQLSEEFAQGNDLVRRKDEHGNPAGGMFDINRRVRTQKLRGEKSDGFWCPLMYLSYLNLANKYLFGELIEGYEFNEVNGHKICDKYISPRTKQQLANISGKRSKRGSHMFKEHFDTPQLGRNLGKLDRDDYLIITEKVHGTSQRVGYVLVDNFSQMHWIKKIFYSNFLNKQSKLEWEYLNGTRRVVIDKKYKAGTGFHPDSLREQAAAPFIGNLRKGETVYFEVVGYDTENALIMQSVDIRAMKDPEFIDKWKRKLWTVDKESFGTLYEGAVAATDKVACTMKYTYGCKPGEHKIFVYRITTTNEEGISMDYSWKDVKTRCAELGVNHVPELEIRTYDKLLYNIKQGLHGAYTGEAVNNEYQYEQMFLEHIDKMSQGPSTLDETHIREGVCIRVEGGLNPISYKHKSFEFKILEGIIKDQDIVDLEEAS